MKGARALTPLEIQAVCAAFDGKYELPLRPTPGASLGLRQLGIELCFYSVPTWALGLPKL